MVSDPVIVFLHLQFYFPPVCRPLKKLGANLNVVVTLHVSFSLSLSLSLYIYIYGIATCATLPKLLITFWECANCKQWSYSCFFVFDLDLIIYFLPMLGYGLVEYLVSSSGSRIFTSSSLYLFGFCNVSVMWLII